MVLLHILASITIVSLISLIGIWTLALKQEFLRKITRLLVAFAAGAFLGAAFFDLLPEIIKKSGSAGTIYVLLGILIFFVMEGFIHWHHCHNHGSHTKPITYVNLLGEAVHNFIDGAVIAAAYIVSIPLGVATTAAIVFHEIPQEISDFAILLHGGFTRKKAIIANFLVALTAFGGAFAAYIFSDIMEQSSLVLIGIAAGGFLYMATTDILPELHKEEQFHKMLSQFLSLIAGLLVMFFLVRIIVE